MLRDLITSWRALTLPEGVAVRFLIVENDTVSHCAEVIAEFAKEAIATGSDLLIFLDDDEVCAPDWLDRLIAGYRASDAVLMGAPLRATRPEGALSRAEDRMFALVAARYREKEDRAARRASLHETPGVTIVTNNWLAETTLFTEHDVWFDEAMRFTGGTDAKFYAEVRALGLPTGWVKDAIVSETIPPARLSFRYQMDRSRDQSNTNFRRKIDDNGWARASVIYSVPAKALSALALALALPFTKGGTLLKLARTLGWIRGRIGALTGSRSTAKQSSG